MVLDLSWKKKSQSNAIVSLKHKGIKNIRRIVFIFQKTKLL